MPRQRIGTRNLGIQRPPLSDGMELHRAPRGLRQYLRGSTTCSAIRRLTGQVCGWCTFLLGWFVAGCRLHTYFPHQASSFQAQLSTPLRCRCGRARGIGATLDGRILWRFCRGCRSQGDRRQGAHRLLGWLPLHAEYGRGASCWSY